MKRINIIQVMSIEGTPFKRAIFDENGDPIIEGGKLKLADCNILDCLDLLIRVFPKDRMTMENITEAARLKGQIIEAHKTTGKVMDMEEGTHTWVNKMLKDDAVGPKIFGMTLLNIIAAVDNFEWLHEKETK